MDCLNIEKINTAVKYIDKWLDVNFRNSRLPGMQVAIWHDDKIIYSNAYGFANSSKGQKMTTDNVFRVASNSKTFTATAILQLLESKKINLDDKLSQYLDWFKSNQDERIAGVTIRQLMNHTAGLIRDGFDSNFWGLKREFPSEAELCDYIKDARLVFESDTVFKYSNFGYGYLGMLIAKISGMTYREYIEGNIIAKLGLNSTSVDFDERAEVNLATGYGRILFNRDRIAFENVNTFGLASATGFCSNAEDMCKYASRHFAGNETIISDASKRQMQHGYWETNCFDEKYGLGMVEYQKDGWSLHGHSGGFPGFVSGMQFDTDKKLAVVVLENASDGNGAMVCRKIINIIDIFQQDNNGILPVDNVSKYEGSFYSVGSTIDIVAIGNKLLAVHPLDWSDFGYAEGLKVKDENTLIIEETGGYNSVGEEINYIFNSDGSIKEIILAGIKLLDYQDAMEAKWF